MQTSHLHAKAEAGIQNPVHLLGNKTHFQCPETQGAHPFAGNSLDTIFKCFTVFLFVLSTLWWISGSLLWNFRPFFLCIRVSK